MEFLRRSLWLCLLIGLVSGQQSRSRAISSSASSGSSTPVDFDCPDEFGYYPHPSDCTQYYVCVFGGALLESCTGGLVYSHELQTCDWPRNVECIPGQISAKSRSQASTARPKVDLRTRKPSNVPPVSSHAPISNEERFTSSISHPFANSGNALPEREPQRASSSRPLTFLEEDLQLQEEFDSNRQSRLFRPQISNNAQQEGRKVGGAFNNKQQTITREPERPTFENSQFYDIDLDSSQHLGGFDPHFSDRSDFIPYGDFARRQGNARPRPTQEFEFVPSRPRAPPSMQFKRNSPGLPLDHLGPVPIRNGPPADAQTFNSPSFGSFHQSPNLPNFQRPNVQDTPSPSFPAPPPFSAPVPLPVNANRRPIQNTHFDTRQFGPPHFPPRDFNVPAQGRPWPTSANVNPNEQFHSAGAHAQNQSPNLNPFTHFRQPTPPQQPLRDREEFTHSTSTSSRPPAPQFFNQFPPSSQFSHEESPNTFFEDQSKFETPQTTPPVRTTASLVHSEVTPEEESGPSVGDDFTTFASESPTTLTRQTATEETLNLRDRPKQQTTFQEASAAPHNGNQFLVQTQFTPDVRDEDFDSWGHQFQTTTRQQQLQQQQQRQQQQQGQRQQQSQPTHRPRPIPDHFFENTPEERPSSVPARPVFQFEEVVTKPPSNPVRISRPSTEAPVSLFDQNVEDFSRPQTPAPASVSEEVFHSVEETDADYEDFEAAAVPVEDTRDWQAPPSEEVVETRTTTTTTSTTTQAPTTRRTTTKPTTTTTTTTTTTPRPSRQPSRTSEEKSRGSTRHQASKPVASSDDDDDAPVQPPKRGSSRPSLKIDALASKAEPFDVSKFPPSRPAPRFAQPRVGDSASKCNSEVCQLPDCNCGGKEIPSGLKAHQTPQLVLLTFDDAVNDLNKELYGDLFETGRVNPNGCPIAATFYVSHEWTDYGQVQSLYADGHEIASHTISHSFGEQFSAKKWAREAAGQRDILAAYGGVKPEDVRGLRAPFLSIGGNNMFKMLYDMNFTYDSSMPVYENKPPSWPYTLDYKLFHDCMIPPCPTKSYPGVWEVPMVMWQDLNGGRCSMGDGCSNPPDAEGVYKMLIKNFERHYTSNRAPFPLYYHAAWFTTPHHKEGFEAFLDTIVAMDDVWLVTNWQAIQWVRDPTPLDKIKSFKPFGCDYPDRPKRCSSPKVCNSWHKSGVRYMRTCQACPDVFPWTGKTGVRDPALDTYEED